MRKLVVLVTVPAAGAALAIPALAATTSVKVGDNYFVRKRGVPTVTVHRGDTVRWRFAGENQHNVAVKSGPVRFHSRPKRSGTFERRMTRSGRYRIYCQIHGLDDQSMILEVR